jgi:cold shock protein
MKKGKVKFYNYSKGYGFIHDNETQKDVFVHSTGLKEEIRDGDEVEFEVQEGKRGLNAVNVKLAN